MPEENKINLPQILDTTRLSLFTVLIDEERQLLVKAAELHRLGFCEYALLGVWNAAVNNLKRRVEAYGVDLWISVVQDEPGRKKYDKDADTLLERWENVDDIVLISGATKLGLLNKKAGKSLEMINWMRNHASAAHDTDNRVEPADVVALAMLLQKNLFEIPLPDPGHSVSSLFDPIKASNLTAEQIILLRDEIRTLRLQDVRICFGFIIDMLCSDKEPAISNAQEFFPEIWARATEDLRRAAGIKYHTLKFDTNQDLALQNRNARNRLLDTLVKVDGVKYIPEAARAQLYRHAAKKLAVAKNTIYGWRDEEVAAKTLSQFGPHVPSVAFEEVYQEILAVWCGNYWGRSSCFSILTAFIDHLNVDQIREIARMFRENDRVKEELFQEQPKQRTIELLAQLESRLTIEAHKGEIQKTIEIINRLGK